MSLADATTRPSQTTTYPPNALSSTLRLKLVDNNGDKKLVIPDNIEGLRSELFGLQAGIMNNSFNIQTVQNDLSNTAVSLDNRIDDLNDVIVNNTNRLITDLSNAGFDLQSQINSNDADIANLRSDLSSNVANLESDLSSNVANLQSQITSNDVDIANLQTDLSNTAVTLENTINTEVSNLQSDLSSNVANLQTQITNNVSDIASLQTDLSNTAVNLENTINTDIANLQADLSSTAVNLQNVIDGDIALLQSDLSSNVANLQSQITSNDGDITNLQTDLSNVEPFIQSQFIARFNEIEGSLTTNVTNLQSQINSNDGDIASLQTDLSNTAVDLQNNFTTRFNSLQGDLSSNVVNLQSQLDSNDIEISALQSDINSIETRFDGSGVLNPSNLPPLAITNVQVVENSFKFNDGLANGFPHEPVEAGDVVVVQDFDGAGKTKTFMFTDGSKNYIELDFGGEVVTVNGLPGPNPVLKTDDIAEGGDNLYFTSARAVESVETVGTLTFSNSTVDFTGVSEVRGVVIVEESAMHDASGSNFPDYDGSGATQDATST